MNVPAWLSVVAVVLGIIAGLGGASAFFRARRGEALIALQNTMISEQARRIEMVETDRTLCQQRLTVLEDMVTGKLAIEALTELVAKQHGDLLKRLDDLLSKRLPAKRR